MSIGKLIKSLVALISVGAVISAVTPAFAEDLRPAAMA